MFSSSDFPHLKALIINEVKATSKHFAHLKIKRQNAFDLMFISVQNISENERTTFQVLI